jgi:hypothetical protein
MKVIGRPLKRAAPFAKTLNHELLLMPKQLEGRGPLCDPVLRPRREKFHTTVTECTTGSKGLSEQTWCPLL